MARGVLLRTRNISDKRCREDQKTFCVQWFFFPTIVPFMW